MMDLPNNKSKTISLPDGRQLGYIEHGSEAGKPVFYFHGRDGSRLEGAFGKEHLADDLGIRLICAERPGMGLSDFLKKRTILDWPTDVLKLASALHIKKFAVVGGSGGAPYALACAYKIPDRLTSCIVAGGLGPFKLSKPFLDRRNRNLLSIARFFPWSVRLLLWSMIGRNLYNEVWWEKNYEKLVSSLPPSDQILVKKPEIKERMIDKTREAYREGCRGPAHDFTLFAKPWGFALEEISPDIRVSLFHGKKDTAVPIQIAQKISSSIPNCEPTFYEEEGHISVWVNRFADIIKSLS
ncbi:MAG: alpha/beta fold hydrolase [Candidatus Heimdallarchaeota archaeon]